jgi:aminoglycoside phosphotransferase family enzyme
MNSEQIHQLKQQKHFPDHPDAVELIETHASWVLLTEASVYKIKKPLVFSFLDFSTLDKRKYYCEQEYVLNSRLAPEMYQGVLPVRESGGQFNIGEGAGKIIDYAVFMKRMDYNRQMDILLERGEVGKEEVADIAVQIAHFHKKVKKFLEEEDVEQIHVRFADIASVSDFLGRHFGPEAESFVEELVQYSADFTGKYASRFQERAQQGFVVDGHGDLHSKNIFLLDKPVIFDCIEFSQEFRRSDVLSDIAFFCMDLDQYGRTDLVTYFMETYLKENPCMQEEADRLIFHYYKMYRANVRLKVNALAAIQFEKEDSLTAARLKEVEAYYLLLKKYMKAL